MTRATIKIETIPPIGFGLSIDGQSYVFAGLLGHVRQDGEPTTLACWSSACWECGAAFEAKTPLGSIAFNRRCPPCRKPGKRVGR